MLYAGGKTVIYSAAGDLLWIQPASVSIAGESEVAEARGVPFAAGPVQVLASAQISSTITATINLQKIGPNDASLILNTKLATLTSFTLPEAIQVTVPASPGPYTVTVTGLTADQTVRAAVVTSGFEASLTQVIDAPDAAREFRVTANTLTFNSTEAGRLVTAVYDRTISTASVLGGASPSTEYGTISFFGRLVGTERNGHIWIRQFTPSGQFDLGLIGNAGNDVAVTGTISTPTGWNRPYLLAFD